MVARSPLNLSDYSELKNSAEVLSLMRSNVRKGRVKEFFPITAYMPGLEGHAIDNKIYQFSGQDFVRIQLNRIHELHHLANMLEDFDPVSIDAFLRDHPEHRIAGQTMIIYCLIRCHDRDKFKIKMPHNDDLSDKNKCLLKSDSINTQDNWYRHLLNDIKSGCKNPSDLLNNNLSIATFNYDVSLDYYLKNKLMNTSYFKDHASDYLGQSKINHIYGSICDFDKLEEFYDLKLKNVSDTIETDILNFHHLLYGYVESSAENSRIQLIGERRHASEISDKIKSSDIIYFIGFSFDADNLRVLGFPEDTNGYGDFLSVKKIGGVPIPKKIFYLDYKGWMNGLHDELQELSRGMNTALGSHPSRPRLIVQRSTASSITSAYVNDFKNRIFS
jgi:hypothetical protein